jgi:hypothetical protein
MIAVPGAAAKTAKRGLDLTHFTPSQQAARMSEEAARLRRMVEQGYTTDVYHGTRQAGFDVFDPHKRDFGIHVTPRPDTAVAATTGPGGPHTLNYASSVDPEQADYWVKSFSNSPIGRPTIMPLKARIQNPVTLPDLGRWDETNYTVDTLINQALTQTGEGIPPYDMEFLRDLQRKSGELLEKQRAARPLTSDRDALAKEWRDFLTSELKRRGHDAIAYPNVTEGAGELSYALFDPSQLRLPWAKFMDPKSASLLASIAAAVGIPGAK